MPTPFRLPGLELHRQGELVYQVEGALGDRFSCSKRELNSTADDCLSPAEVCALVEELESQSPYPLPLPPNSPIFFSVWTYFFIEHFSVSGNYGSAPPGCGGQAPGSYHQDRYYSRWGYAPPGGYAILEVHPDNWSGPGGQYLSSSNAILFIRDNRGRTITSEGCLYQSQGGRPGCTEFSTIFNRVLLTIEDTTLPPYVERESDPEKEDLLKQACEKGESARRSNGRGCAQFEVLIDILKGTEIIDTYSDGIVWNRDRLPPVYKCQEILEQICPDNHFLCGSPESGCCFDCSAAAGQIGRISSLLSQISQRF
jgi:hypothetical protein